MSCSRSESRTRVGRLLPLVAVIASTSLMGCASLNLPERFLVVERDIGAVKAITPDEAKVWMRTFVEPGGDLAFWAEAVEKDFVDNRGYVLIDKGELETAGGKAFTGVFETTAQGETVRYFVALSVKKTLFGESEITVIEYAADKELFETYLEDVRAAVKAR